MRSVDKCFAVLITLVIVLVAPGHQTDAADRLTVVTTTTDLKPITEWIGGDKVEVTSICRGYEDPHFIQAKPSYMMTARKAHLWIRIGLELEIGWESLILDGSRNRRIRPGTRGYLDASEGVLRLEVPTVRVTREMGDIHPLGNPHYWLDPLNARIMASTIADRLAELAPEHSEIFAENTRSFREALDEHVFGAELVRMIGGDKLWALELKGALFEFLDENGLRNKLGGWMGKLGSLRGEGIITYHRSWSYFANRFRLVVADELEPKPGIPPSPGHVLEVIGKVRAQKIRVLLMEPYRSRKAPELVAAKTGIRVVTCANSVGGEPAAQDYLSMIGNIVDKLVDAFEAVHAGGES